MTSAGRKCYECLDGPGSTCTGVGDIVPVVCDVPCMNFTGTDPATGEVMSFMGCANDDHIKVPWNDSNNDFFDKGMMKVSFSNLPKYN